MEPKQQHELTNKIGRNTNGQTIVWQLPEGKAAAGDRTLLGAPPSLRIGRCLSLEGQFSNFFFPVARGSCWCRSRKHSHCHDLNLATGFATVNEQSTAGNPQANPEQAQCPQAVPGGGTPAVHGSGPQGPHAAGAHPGVTSSATAYKARGDRRPAKGSLWNHFLFIKKTNSCQCPDHTSLLSHWP